MIPLDWKFRLSPEQRKRLPSGAADPKYQGETGLQLHHEIREHYV